MIRINATSQEIEAFENEEGISGSFLSLINDAFKQHENNKMTMKGDIDYYKGEKPFNKNSYYSLEISDGGHIVFEEISKQNINYAKYIVDQETSIFVGKAPQISVATNNKTETNRINEYNRQMSYRNWKEQLTEAIRNKSKVGRGYLLVHNKEKDEFPRFSSLDPLNTFVAYDLSIDPDSLFGGYINDLGKGKYSFYIYTPNFVYVFNTSKKGGNITAADDFEKIPHSFGRVPINEFRNNDDEQSSIEPVKGLITLLCAVQNDIVRGNHEAVKSILHINGLAVGSKTEQETFIDTFLKTGVLATQGEVKATILNNTINQTQAQETKKQILQDMWSISRTADFSSADFAQSASEPALKLKLKGVIDKALDGEKFASPTIKRIMKCVLSYVEQESPKLYEKVKFDINRLSIDYFHPLPSSDLATSTILANLYSMNMFNPELMKQFTFMKEDLQTYMDGVVQKPIYEQMKVEQGNNNANKEKQDEKPQDMKQEDNQTNFAQKKANDIK
jgi:SPP1 family phage portal protein